MNDLPDPITGLGPLDLHLFNEGRHRRLYEHLGAHPIEGGGASFAVFAPNAARVSLVHDANGWQAGADPLEPIASSGIWAGAVGAIKPGELYKYLIEPRGDLPARAKADPFAFAAESPPRSASVLTDLGYEWSDGDWMAARRDWSADSSAVSAYEVHLGSWQRGPNGELLSYEELGHRLAAHVGHLGFTHIELLPVMEHPYYGSWGYQVTGFFAPTARHGPPAGLMALIDTLHQHGIGVILDWVPSHFATNAFGLGEFDGTHVYEHAHPLKRIHPDWGSFEFNYGRHEVRSFLMSSACFWLDRYHADGLRVDAVASMLYLDYSRKDGEWMPNRYGGREDLDTIQFLRECNDAVHESFPGALMIAEESTAWPGVSKPVVDGGLGFDMKWDMGWMHDTLAHLARDPLFRGHHYDELTFRGLYAFSERFVLPLSHDEVVHGKGSLLGKMPGDDWKKLANLRLLYAYQFTQPGKKLLFMGSEIGTWREWDHESELDWGLLASPRHAGLASLMSDLNHLYRDLDALHDKDFEPDGFAWVIADDASNDVLAFLRRGATGEALVVVNLTPVIREDYRVGVATPGTYQVALNTDDRRYGGSGAGPAGEVRSEPEPSHGFLSSISLTVPPLAVVLLLPQPGEPDTITAS